MSRHFRTGANSSTVARFARIAVTLTLVTLVFVPLRAPGQSASDAQQPTPTPVAAQESAPAGPGLTLLRRLSSAGLDPKAVYGIRDAALNREDVHITLDDGVIGFLEAVDGHITGAFFEGEGEILLVPPDRAERSSLGLFTGAAVLEEKFTTAYFRFNDDTAEELRPALRPAEEPEAFIAKWASSARTLADSDGLRLMTSFLNQQPPPPGDHMLRVRLHGARLGIFDVYFDTLSAEQIAVLKFNYAEGLGYYDVLASFPMRSARGADRDSGNRSMVESAGTLTRMRISGYKMRVRVQPPHLLDAEAQLDIEVRQGGDRISFFELSRYLKVREVLADGKPVEFLQNEALEGTALARRGNDVVAVVFPEPLRAGQRLQLKFSYAGSVLSDAGGGLLYVGARGIWYPNRGMVMADFDLEFRYPSAWTLVATGKRVSQSSDGEEQVSRWISERPIPLAGFNLGQYTVGSAKAGAVVVEAYATSGVEHTFRTPRPVVVIPADRNIHRPAVTMVPPGPQPASNAETVAQTSARAINFFSRHFGPYPYSSLVLSQMPGTSSQGWPGLVFLSSYAFLSPEERAQMRLRPPDSFLYDQFMQIHETAHQWWGDLIGWKSYRDQWLVEALSNYSALLALEKDRPELCKALLTYYRDNLLTKNKDNKELTQAGAVTLGLRLSSSQFPDGFDGVSYGRGTWLMHMLRSMLRDAARPPAKPGAEQEEPFLRALGKLRRRFEGRAMSTSDFQQVMEEELPESLRYEGKKSLDWFFQTWVNGTAVPHLELKDVKFARDAGAKTVRFTILQKDAPDELITSVPVYASTGRGLVLLGRVFADGLESSHRFNVPLDARKLVLDPHATVLTRP